MPRTKVKRNVSVPATKKLNVLETKKSDFVQQLLFEKIEAIEEYKLSIYDCISSIPKSILNMELDDLLLLKSQKKQPEPNKSKKPKQKVQRSLSAGDEGYLTTDSTSSTTRKSRSRVTKTTTRVSRSASRSKFKTPATCKTKKLNEYALVTPKCQVNVKPALLRRPKNGEYAISLQGSPIYTNAVIEDKANINVPLKDGRLLNLLPLRGLDLTQIPKLDSDTLKQLKILRENLDKVFEGKKYQ